MSAAILNVSGKVPSNSAARLARFIENVRSPPADPVIARQNCDGALVGDEVVGRKPSSRMMSPVNHLASSDAIKGCDGP
jgi:hypothetical protein